MTAITAYSGRSRSEVGRVFGDCFRGRPLPQRPTVVHHRKARICHSIAVPLGSASERVICKSFKHTVSIDQRQPCVLRLPSDRLLLPGSAP